MHKVESRHFQLNRGQFPSRDLADLVEKGALVREGERRYARYRLAVPLRPVPHLTQGTR